MDLHVDVFCPVVHIFLLSHMAIKNTTAAKSWSAFSSTACKWFCLVAFPFLRDFMGEIISSFSDGSMSTSRSVSASCMSVSAVGGSLWGFY